MAREDVFCSYHFSQARKNGPGIYAWEILESEFDLRLFVLKNTPTTTLQEMQNKSNSFIQLKEERKRTL